MHSTVPSHLQLFRSNCYVISKRVCLPDACRASALTKKGLGRLWNLSGTLVEKEVANGTGGRKISLAQSTMFDSAFLILNLTQQPSSRTALEHSSTGPYRSWLAAAGFIATAPM